MKPRTLLLPLLCTLLLLSACGSAFSGGQKDPAPDPEAAVPEPQLEAILDDALDFYFGWWAGTALDENRSLVADADGFSCRYYRYSDPEVTGWADFRDKGERLFVPETFDALFRCAYQESDGGLYFALTEEGNSWDTKAYITAERVSDTEYALVFELFEMSFDPPARVDFAPERATGSLLYRDGAWKLQLDSPEVWLLIYDYELVETDAQREELERMRSNHTVSEAMQELSDRNREAEISHSSDQFAETEWMLVYGQTNGTAMRALFHADGTFEVSHLGSDYAPGGTWRYDGERLYIPRYDFSAGSFSGEEIAYTWDGTCYVSELEYDMMVGRDHFRVNPIG